MSKFVAPSISVNWKVVVPILLFILTLIYYFGFHGENAGKQQSQEVRGTTEDGIFYRQIGQSTESNPSFAIVFLHGAAFTSQTWKDLGTLDYFADLKYSITALDLPGYGKSKEVKTPLDRGQWLATFLEKLHIERPVIVSPSMSGSFAVPFVMSGQAAAKERLRGFIPVAPTSTGKFTKEDYERLALPTLIIYGENDTSLGVQSLENLRNIPGSIVHMMKGANHPCYLKDPKDFHTTVEMSFFQRSKTTYGIPTRKKPCSDMYLDMKSFVRQPPYEQRDKQPNNAQQRLWLDMTEVEASNLSQVDAKYNSNMWKNFRFVRARSSTVGKSKAKDSMQALIADSYPLTLPKPSSIGENTYQKYLQEAKLSKKKRHRIEVQQQKGGKQEFEKTHLKLRSDCRAPPIDWEGNILPPENFRRYPRALQFFDESEDYSPLPYTYTLYAPSPTPSYSRSGTPWRYGLRVRQPHIGR